MNKIVDSIMTFTDNLTVTIYISIIKSIILYKKNDSQKLRI